MKKAGLDDDGEEIDDDTELMYLQALEVTGDDDGDSQPEEDAKMKQRIPTPAPAPGDLAVSSASSSAKKRPLSPAAAISAEPKKVSKAQAKTKTAKSQCGASPLSPSLPAQAAPASASQVLPAPAPPVAVAAKQNQAADGAEKASRETWSKCKAFCAEEFGGSKPGQPLAVPSKYTKDTQIAKWDGEVTKLRPFIATIERLLASEGCKVKDTEVKNAIKSFQKVNAKVDKRLEYEAAIASAEEPVLSARMAYLKDVLEALKSLKELAVSSGKSGSISEATLKTNIDRVNTAVQKLIRGQWTGFPLFWVQARLRERQIDIDYIV